MQRREFLIKSAAFLAGGILGLEPLSKALADPNSSFLLPIPKRKTESSNHKVQIALIIDDFGESLPAAARFLELEAPLTYAVLPLLAKSEEIAYQIHEAGHEILLHQPMEPHGANIDPGPGAVYVGDDAQKISQVVAANIAKIPFATGVNNHMGSRFTEYPREMTSALAVVKERGLFFIDSLTSGHSQAYKTARNLHIPWAYRHIFLDNSPEEAAILSQLRQLKRRALQRGQAIGIGHHFPETARAIKKFLKELQDTDIALVYSSDLLFENP
ncbi:MAG: divergent polysaccharide deacetylase family protein [Desulfobacteraceae bacterium]|nr:MAG: divergent polysaccharide deacetylase family protein [Desulfobacteraceae bacterium]